MFDADHWREIREALTANKLRTALTAFGVAWGAFMLVAMLGSGNGLRTGVEREYAGQAKNSFYVWTRRTSKPWRGLPAGRSWELTTADVEAIQRAVPTVDVVATRSQLGGYSSGFNVTRGKLSGGFNVMADDPSITSIFDLRVTDGRFLNRLDVSERRKVAVIGPRVRDVLFPNGEDPVGESISILGIDFRVVGIVTSGRSGDEADRDAQSVHVPASTYRRAFNQGNRVGWLALTSRAGVPASRAERDVLALLARRHSIAPDDGRAFGHFNTEERFLQVAGLFAGIKTLVWIVGLGTLAAGVIGVSNIMLIIVRERTHEIGIRRAIGATPQAIVGQVLLESLLLTSVAGYAGVAAATAVLAVVGAALPTGSDAGMFAAPSIDLATTLRALAVLVIAGALAGVLPAHRSVSVHPVDALRLEA